MKISIASYSFHGALTEGTAKVLTYLEACFDRLDAALSILTEARHAGCLGVERHTCQNEFPEVKTQVELVRRGLSHRRTGGAGQHQGNPLLCRDNRLSHNR